MVMGEQRNNEEKKKKKENNLHLLILNMNHLWFDLAFLVKYPVLLYFLFFYCCSFFLPS